ncbi:hypothetical protein ACFQNI_13415 [Salinirubellus salinus]
MTRRRLVTTGAATWATVNLAGCDRIDDPGTQAPSPAPTTEPGSDGSGTTTVTAQTTTTDAPGNQTDGTDGTDAQTATQTATPTEGPTTTTACADIDRFAAGMEIGLHVGVYDSDTGTFLGDSRLDTVTVEFPGAEFEPMELRWSGPHERYSEDGWGGKIVTSPDAEPGTYRYEITVEGASTTDGPETVTGEFTVL